MKKITFFAFIIIFFLSFKVLAVEEGKWDFVVEDNYCYVGSTPIKQEGNYTKRGDTYIIVYRINKNPEKIVQITAGYIYDVDKPITVKIDETLFEFFGDEDSAWIKKNDKAVVLAMRKGIIMTIKGYSARGTLTTDTYTLKGFTSADNKLSKDC